MIYSGREFVVRLQSQIVGFRRVLVKSATTARVVASSKAPSLSRHNECGFSRTRQLTSSSHSSADKPVSRPKAHTGRITTPRKKASTTAATKAAKVPVAITRAPKAIPGEDDTEAQPEKKAKPASKAKVKAKAKAKAKPGPKPQKKAKAKPRPKPKKILTEKQKIQKASKEARTKVKALRERSLLDQAPKPGSTTAWMVFSAERSAAMKEFNSGAGMKESSRLYKALTPEQLEHYNHVANQNKAAYLAAHSSWLNSFTPAQIRSANLARHMLNRKSGKKGGSKHSLLQDGRQTKQPARAYSRFTADRYHTGDFKGIKLPVASRLIAKEWMGLSEDERKPYHDQARADLERYQRDLKDIPGDEQ